MNEPLKNTAIGIFMLIALALSIWLLLFLHPRVGDAGKTMKVLFTNIDKVGIGTRVTFAGRPVGEVIAIRDATEGRHSEEQDPIFAFELSLALDSKVTVYDSDEIMIRTSGLMGERSIAIIPRKPKKGQPRPLENEEIVRASSSGSMEDTVIDLQSVARKAEKTIDEVFELINSNQQDIHLTLKSIQKTSDEAEHLLRQCNQQDIVGSLTRTIDHFSEVMEDIRRASGQAKQTMVQTQQILQKIANGEGFIGKTLVSDEMYLKTTSIMNKMDVLMNDINSYGVLFHLDKGWQRQRHKRGEENEKLQAPDQLKKKLFHELNQISLSVAQANEDVEKAESEKDKAKKEELQKIWIELLTKVRSLEHSLETYSNHKHLIEKQDK